MGTPPSNMDEAVKKAQRRILMADLRKTRWVTLTFLAVVGLALAYLVVLNFSPRHVKGLVEGRTQASFASASRTNNRLEITVALPDGRTVVVTHPRALAYRPNARVQLRVSERANQPGSAIYAFERYVDDP